MPLRPSPALMSPAELDEACDAEMAKNPMGSPHATMLIDENERRNAGPMIEVADSY